MWILEKLPKTLFNHYSGQPIGPDDVKGVYTTIEKRGNIEVEITELHFVNGTMDVWEFDVNPREDLRHIAPLYWTLKAEAIPRDNEGEFVLDEDTGVIEHFDDDGKYLDEKSPGDEGYEKWEALFPELDRPDDVANMPINKGGFAMDEDTPYDHYERQEREHCANPDLMAELP